MSSVPQSIIERIQKLHALAERAGTEAEAALAAQRVADLCRQHNLEIGVAVLAEQETEASESLHEHDGSRWAAHWSSLGRACDALFGVAHYRSSGAKAVKNAEGYIVRSKQTSLMHFYGLKASVQSALMTYQYFLASVESLLEGAIATEGLFGASDMRSFRMGCAARIAEEANKVSAISRQQLQNNSEVAALVVLENGLIKAHSKKMHLHRSCGASGASNHGAYMSGFRAGGRVDLHGARTSRMIR